MRERAVNVLKAPISRAALVLAVLLCGVGQAQAAEPKPLKIKPATLKLATATVPYSANLTAGGGTGPYVFTLQSGDPPAGISLSPSGELTGTATEDQTSTFTVLVTDSSEPAAKTATATYTLGVQLDEEPASLGKATVGRPFSVVLGASGGSGEYNYERLPAGELPPGVELINPAGHGSLAGTPTVAGTYSFSIVASDAVQPGVGGLRTYKLKVALGLSREERELPEATVGSAYSTQIQALGGSGDYSYTLGGGGPLPEGLELDEAGGTITGTPLAAGRSAFTIVATDLRTGLSRSQNYKLRVSPGARFPSGTFFLEETENGSQVGAEGGSFTIKRESHGVVSGTDRFEFPGTFSYDPATHEIQFTIEEFPGSLTPYSGSCNAAAETCSGHRDDFPGIAFTLRRPGE